MPTDIFLNLCAIATAIVLIISLYVRKQTQGQSNILFMMLCLCVTISGSVDILGRLFDTVIQVTSSNLFLCYIVYYMAFLMHSIMPVLYILYLYSQVGLWYWFMQKKSMKLFCFLPMGIWLLLLVSNPWSKLVFNINENGQYAYGNYFVIFLVALLYYLVYGSILLIRYRNQVQKSEFWALMIYLIVGTPVVVVINFFGDLHIDNMLVALVLLIVILGVQRPEDKIDPIVGVMSKIAFLEDMRQAFNLSSPMALLFVNFTNHATLRNNLGIFTYNTLLTRLANKTNQISRIMQLHPDIYYLDNGTFAIKTDISNTENLLDLGRMVHAYMQEPVRLDHMEVMVDTMVCLVKCPEDIDDHDTFINFSRSFHQKLPRQNRVILLSHIATSRDFILRSRIDTIIKKGITNQSFKMYYQPIYSLKKHRFVSAEALIRLIDDEYGFVSPAIFIPAAEESGAIHQIGNFVFDDVCRFIASEEFKELGLEYIEINLSISQCIEQDLAEKVMGYMDKYGISPSQLNLEITETAVDYDPTTTDSNIRKLADLDISFSLDDYGTGYSNIRRVVSLPLSIVKLDKTLVDDMDSHQMWIVIKNTVRMLQRMNKKILVEGVETERALMKFDQIGCDYIQGYYFSKPLSEEDFIDFIRESNKFDSLSGE